MKYLDQIFGRKPEIERIDYTKLFKNIVGHEPIKQVFQKVLISNEAGNVLLDGPPACSKTLFLLALKPLKDAFWADNNSSGAGILDAMFDRDVKILLIDEIDKLKRNDQTALLNLIETGILSSVKVKNKEKKGTPAIMKQFKNLKVFCTANELERCNKALLSRFTRFSMHEYTEQEFLDIAQELYPLKDPQLVEYAARATLKILKSNDIRDFKGIIKHANNAEDVDLFISTQLKYSPPKEEENV